jgi:hypothetical protein
MVALGRLQCLWRVQREDSLNRQSLVPIADSTNPNAALITPYHDEKISFQDVPMLFEIGSVMLGGSGRDISDPGLRTLGIKTGEVMLE